MLSSEWDYSPHVFPRSIPGYSLLGVPACESSNPFLLPLAGHELGHSLWRQVATQQGSIAALRSSAAEHVVSTVRAQWSEHCRHFPTLSALRSNWDAGDLEVQASYYEALEWALCQLEECFCDLVGLHMFGEAFPHACEYLLSPTWGNRSPEYPSNQQRAKFLVRGADAYGVAIDDDYETQFELQSSTHLSAKDSYLLDLADGAVAAHSGGLIEAVQVLLESRGIQPPRENDVADATRRLESVCPIEGAPCLATIVAAAWRASRDSALWSDSDFIADKPRVLRELVIKSIEVHQIEFLTGE